MCINIYLYILNRRGGDPDRKFIKYSAYACGGSLLMLALAIVMQFTDIVDNKWRPGIGDTSCWLTSKF